MLRQLTLLAALWLCACAYVPKTVEPKLQLSNTTNNIGAGQIVSLTVIDERLISDLGNRSYDNAARVSISNNLVPAMHSAIATAIARQGFQIDAGASKRLRIDLRDLRWTENQGVLTIGHSATTAIKATVLDNDRVLFENVYRKEVKTKGIAVAPGSTISNHVNAALSNAIDEMLVDPRLLQALTTPRD